MYIVCVYISYIMTHFDMSNLHSLNKYFAEMFFCDLSNRSSSYLHENTLIFCINMLKFSELIQSGKTNYYRCDKDVDSQIKFAITNQVRSLNVMLYQPELVLLHFFLLPLSRVRQIFQSDECTETPSRQQIKMVTYYYFV